MKRTVKSVISFALIFVLVFSSITFCSPKGQAADVYVKQNVFFFLKNKMGLNTAAACGVMANIEKESNFNTGTLGDQGTSYGICQWHDGRWTNLKNFCNANGYDWQSLTGQLYYLKYELSGSYYSHILNYLRSRPNTAQGAYDAAYYFCYWFEVPADIEYMSTTRGNLAKSSYWGTYGFNTALTAPSVSLDSQYLTVNSKDGFTVKWTASQGSFNQYKINIVKCIDMTAEYDWSNMITYTVASNKTSHTVPPATLSSGNYLVYVYAYNSSNRAASDYSNLLFFRSEDELIFANELPVDGTHIDASSSTSFYAKGWAINSGKCPITFYGQIDSGERVRLTNVSRPDIYAEYSKFCTNDKIGYNWKVDVASLTNGNHTVSIFIESKSLTGIIAQHTVTVDNTHTHSYGEYVYNNDATYSSDGTKTAVCSLCSSKKTVTATGTMLKLAKPSNFTAAPSSDSVTLKWSKVTGAAGYRVFVSSASGWVTLKNINATSYKVTGLSGATSYRFAVRAYTSGKNGVVWAPSYSTVTTVTKPAPPKTLTATQTTDSVTLSWSASDKAVGYRVFRLVSGKWKSLKTTGALSYTVTGLSSGSTYTFAVLPYNRDQAGNVVWASAYTKLVTATKTATTSIRLATTAVGRATVAWENIVGENGYQVWYSESPSGPFIKASNYAANTAKAYVTGLQSGKTYYFSVRSYKKPASVYIYSSFSPIKSVTIK